jgi:hypothetical protein
MKKPVGQRLEEKTDRSGGPDACWPWLGSCLKMPDGSKGYGQMCVGGVHTYAHIVALVDDTGELPDGRQALHSCDNRPCCNPGHLRWGTNGDNQRDRYARRPGRVPRGAAHGRAVLTSDQVAEIRRRYVPRQKGNTLAALGAEFGVSLSAIHLIVSGHNWSTL